MPRRKEPRIPDALLDQLLGGADAKTAFDRNGLLDELKKALAERALNAEIDHHLGGEVHDARDPTARRSLTSSGQFWFDRLSHNALLRLTPRRATRSQSGIRR